MKTVILGGTGWVGHRIAQEFMAKGYETRIFCRGRKKQFAGDWASKAKFVYGDKNNEDDVKNLFKEPAEIVIDSVPTISSLNHVFHYAKGLEHYLHCSSTGAYAPLLYAPADENHPYRPFGGGGWKGKVEVDGKAMELFSQHGFPATVIRPTYITGPGALPIDNLGGRDESFLPDILAGKTLDVANDGQALLQPVHVQDLARTFLNASQTPRCKGEIFIVTSEKAIPVNRYLELTARSISRTALIQYSPLEDLLKKYPDRANRIGLTFFATHMCFSIEKAKREIAYQPRFDAESAIEDTIRWWQATQPRA